MILWGVRLPDAWMGEGMLGLCNSAGGEVGVCLIKNKSPQSLPTHPGFRVPLAQLILSERGRPDQGEKPPSLRLGVFFIFVLDKMEQKWMNAGLPLRPFVAFCGGKNLYVFFSYLC